DTQASGAGLALLSLDWAARLLASRCALAGKGGAKRFGSKHNSGNDGGELASGSGGRGRDQVRRALPAYYRIVTRAAGGCEMKLSSSTRKRPRNQRVSNSRQRKQQHLLDVKVRARKATQYRNRRVLVFISKIALAAAICAGMYFCDVIWWRRFFFENPEYRLAMIDVQTD